MTKAAKGREGPKITLSVSCFGCQYEKSESYRCQGDSGQNVYCTHSALTERTYVGDTRWDTPAWCPVKSKVLDEVRALLKGQDHG